MERKKLLMWSENENPVKIRMTMAFNDNPLYPPTGYPTCSARFLQTCLEQYSAFEVCYSDAFGLEVVCFHLEEKWWIVSSKHES